MSTSDYLALAALLISIAGLIYREGAARERQRQLEVKAKEWADGTGRLARDVRSKDERRWKHMIATLIDIQQIDSKEKRTELIAKLLHEDAWRH